MIVRIHAVELFEDNPVIDDYFFKLERPIKRDELLTILKDGLKRQYYVEELGYDGDEVCNNAIFFGRELGYIDPDYLAKHSITQIVIPRIDVDWDNGNYLGGTL